MRFVALVAFLCFIHCASTRELIIEKKQYEDVKENVLKGTQIVKEITLPDGMLKIIYKE